MSSVYPGAIDTDATLYVAADNVQTKLSAPMAIGDTAAMVISSAGWLPNMIATVDVEQMLVLSVAGNILGVSRGFGGTSPAAHASGKSVSNFVDAAYQSALKSSLIAVETALGPNLGNITPSKERWSSTYNFGPLTSGSGVTTAGGNLVVGNNVLTFATVPAGMNGTDTNHWLYVSGTGTPEPALITGGSGKAGDINGQIIIQCKYPHPAGWMISSAAGGIPEAIQAAGGPGKVMLPSGNIPVHGPIYVPAGGYVIQGQGTTNTTLYVDGTYPVSDSSIKGAPFVLGVEAVHRGEFSEFQVTYYQPDSPNYADYIHYQPTFYGYGAPYVRIHHVNTNLAWVTGDFRGNGTGLNWSDSYISGYNTALYVGGNGDFNNLTGLVTLAGYECTTNQATVYRLNTIGFSLFQAFVEISNCVSLATTGWLIDGGGGGGWVQFVNTGFDTGNGITATNYALIQISNCYFNLASISDHAINATNCNVFVNNAWFTVNVFTHTNNPLISATGGIMSIRGCNFQMSNIDTPILSASGNGQLIFSDNTIQYSNQSYTNPVISLGVGMVANITGNLWPPLFAPSTGTGIAFLPIGVGNKGPVVITGNNFIGAFGTSPWGITGLANVPVSVIASNLGYP